MTSTPFRLVFSGKQQVALEPFQLDPLTPNSVRIRTEFSLMSTGTENIVFNRFFDPGTHWDQWVKYPFYPGYTLVGTVEEVGPAVTEIKPGDRVAARQSHRSHVVVEASQCFLIPQGLSFENAVWFSLAKIAFHGALAARYRLGDSVLIVGAGPIGQMSVRWARAAGAAAILVVDVVPDRMKLARSGGATATITGTLDTAKAEILAACEGKSPRVVIDSTGNSDVFSKSLGVVADRGTVVILGDTGQPCHQTLTTEVITRGLTIVGTHDNHNTPEWNNHTISQLFFKLAESGRFSLEGLNTHRFLPHECEEAYTVANRDRSKTMGILFDWSALR